MTRYARQLRSSYARAAACLIACALVAGCESGGLKPNPSLADAGANQAQRIREASELAIQAKAAADEGEVEEAIDLNRRAIALDATLAGAWNNLGVLLMQQQNYRDAIEAFSRAADLLPADPRPYENIAHSYREAGYSSDAYLYFTKSLERDPNWLNSLRGVVACAQELNLSNPSLLANIRRGLLIESDPAWRMVFNRAKLRVEAELKHGSTPEISY